MPKVNSKRKVHNFFPENELRRRELGFKCNLGWEGKLKYSLYSALNPINSWGSQNVPSNTGRGLGYGGIFNLEFSPDGKQLVAACEKQAVLVFDPLTRKEIFKIDDAHSDCVNCIKFLDSRLFATCSDDKTVAIWDARNLSKRISLLKGHNNWVKNIEFSAEEGILVTSAFDGKILGWDINQYTENGLKSTELFNIKGLMRMRLNPDASKLILCTSGGYLMLVHNLSLTNLAKDYRKIDPTNPRHFLKNKRNRLEFISDFPSGNYAELIHSLQVHPHGWCVLSRNTSSDTSSEWTCVHDIQDIEDIDVDENDNDSSSKPEIPRPSPHYALNSRSENATNSSDTEPQRVYERSVRLIPRAEVVIGQVLLNDEREGSSGSNYQQANDPDTIVGFAQTLMDRGISVLRPSSDGSYDIDLTARIPWEQRNVTNDFYIRSRTSQILSDSFRKEMMLKSVPRLTNYREEPNKGQGFIKELCFSSDGRLICSPFDCGIRLLMFDQHCSELSHCVQKKAQPLHAVSTSICHTNCVVSTKFSPFDCLLVSGSLGGEIVWHQPII